MKRPLLYEHEKRFWARMSNVHPAGRCAGRVCVVHRPEVGRWRRLPILWRVDRRIVERICAHGIGHPDPSQFEFWDMTSRIARAVHGCDGCCVSW